MKKASTTAVRRPAVKKTAAPKTTPAATSAVKASESARPPKSDKPAKSTKPGKKDRPAAAEPSKTKLVRDGFTMPESEFRQIAALKARALGLQRSVKKSEVLRAGLLALQALKDEQLLVILESLPVIKTGRPKKNH